MTNVPQVLGVTALVALPLCYYASVSLSYSVRQALAGVLWAVFLGIAASSADEESLPVYSHKTMVTSVLAFIFPLKLTQQMLYPTTTTKEITNGSKDKKEDGTSGGSTDASEDSMSLIGFLTFAGSFFYYMVPVSKSKSDKLPTWSALHQKTVVNGMQILAKLFLLKLLDRVLQGLASGKQHLPVDSLQSFAIYMLMLVLFTVSIVAGTWAMDMNGVVIELVTGGRYELLAFNNYPFSSQSLREFWGKRYNCLINALLKETVYIPAQVYHGLSKPAASGLAFFVSGVLHSWVSYFTFRDGLIRAVISFSLQAVWIFAVESKTSSFQQLPRPLRLFLTFCFFYLSMGLYAGLFIEVMPEWLEKNPPQIPNNIPVLYDAADAIASKLGFAAVAASK